SVPGPPQLLPLSLHDALPICLLADVPDPDRVLLRVRRGQELAVRAQGDGLPGGHRAEHLLALAGLPHDHLVPGGPHLPTDAGDEIGRAHVFTPATYQPPIPTS